ncbi:hypothetical protein PMIN07_002963 [Paraphaeosphaeria minitans]
MAYTSKYHDDSDEDYEASDEHERSVIQSPTLPVVYAESSPTSSGPMSTEHTPTTFTHSRDTKGSPTGLITEWTKEQAADFVAGLGLDQYADTLIEHEFSGEVLVEVQHAELKEIGLHSVGHRLTILKAVYEIKVKQNVPIEPDHYVPLSADTSAQDAPPTQEDFAKVIRVVQARDERLHASEMEIRHLKEDLNRVLEDYKKLRDETLAMARAYKDSQQPLPTPHDHSVTSPPAATGGGVGSSLSPSIAGGQQMSPNAIPQPSPTSPAYHTNNQNRSYNSRSAHPDHDSTQSWSRDNSTWSDSTMTSERARNTPAPLRAPMRNAAPTPNADDRDPPLSGGTMNSTPSAQSSSTNPQVEIFKSFRVSIDDPCHKVLPVALKKYNITADWRQYALYIVHGDQERCLGLNERPLILFKQLDKEGRKPMFMLRKHAAPAEGHVSTVGGNDIRSVGGGTGSFGWDGNNRGVQLPGGVL